MTGPFVVKHLERPPATCRFGHAMDDGLSECPACGVERPSGSIALRVVSVKAFETLAEAHDAAAFIIDSSDANDPVCTPYRTWAALREQVRALPAEGGKVELPDGSEIVVEVTTWVDVILAARDAGHEVHSSASSDADLIAAFNAAMAERYTGGLGA